MSTKVYYTEHIKFDPARAWVVIGPDNRIVSLHVRKSEAEKKATSLRVSNPDLDVTFTRCVVMPNFSIKS